MSLFKKSKKIIFFFMRNVKKHFNYICFFVFFPCFLLFLVCISSLKTMGKTQKLDLNFLCQKNHFSNKNSNEKDTVFMYAANFSYELRMAIKSLRGTGTKARIVVFTDLSFSANFLEKEFLSCHKVEIVKSTEVPTGLHNNATDYWFKAEYKWLTTHLSETRRILHINPLNAFFQRDPFTKPIPSEKLSFFLDQMPIWKRSNEKQVISTLFDSFRTLELENNFSVSTDIIYGSSTHYYHMLIILVHMSEWKKYYGSVANISQALLDTLLWSGSFKEQEIDVSYNGCYSKFLILPYCVGFNENLILNDKGEFTINGDFVPSIVKNYNYFEHLKKHFEYACSIKRYDFLSL